MDKVVLFCAAFIAFTMNLIITDNKPDHVTYYVKPQRNDL